jgi:hypothetical protein
MASTTQAAGTTTYSGVHNARFLQSQIALVDLSTRLKNTLSKLPRKAQANWHSALKVALAQFRKNNPGLNSLNLSKGVLNRKKFPICQAIDVALKQILIDITMQREPDIKWLLSIITNFRAYQASSIQIYQTPDGKWAAWDSQHTALAIYLIAVHGLGMDLDEVVVPCTIYSMGSRGQLRSCYISNNSYTGVQRGKKPLDQIDIVEQMIYGVQVDGVTDHEWVDWHTKWKIFASAGMFFAAEKFNNTDQTGAISRLEELGTCSEDVAKQFAIYGKYMMENQATATINRPIDTKELPLIIELLNMFEAEGIRLTEQDIENMAQHLIDKFNADFTTNGPFWNQVHQAVCNAWQNYNVSQNIPQHLWGTAPRNSKTVPVGYNFLWSQLTHTWAPQQNIQMPKRPAFTWTLNTQYLF